MVTFTVDQIRQIMDNRTNIRNLSIIAQVEHGKSTFSDLLIVNAGVISQSVAGEPRFFGGHLQQDVCGRCITIPSVVVPMYWQPSEKDAQLVKDDDQIDKDRTRGFWMNLVASPGYVDFSGEATAAFRMTDGAIVVVDAVDGVGLQTETALRQALSDRVKPVLFINKLDRAILELQIDQEDLFQTFSSIITSINAILITHFDNAGRMENPKSDPVTGNCAFGSARHAWAFTLKYFAEMYAAKFLIEIEKLTEKLWGDNFYNAKTKKWSKTKCSEDDKRAFCLFVLDPIYKIFDAVMNFKREEIEKLMGKLKIELNEEEKETERNRLLKMVMQKWLPAKDVLFAMIVVHLPSPVTAQKYRMEVLYDGPHDDEAAVAIKTCDPDGPLMMYITRMVPTSDRGRSVAFGRVFSGTTVRTGQKVRIMGDDSVPGKDDAVGERNIKQTALMMGRYIEDIESLPAGNICGLMGIDQFLWKSGTIATSRDAYNLKKMKFSVSPVVRVAIEPKNPADLPKLVEGLRRLAKNSLTVHCYVEESGEQIITGVGELHLASCLEDLEDYSYARVPFKASDPCVIYRETVSEESSRVCLSKSVNKLNTLYMKALPMPDIDNGEVNSRKGRILADKYGYDEGEGRKISCFDPDTGGSNVQVGVASGVQFLNDNEASVTDAFQGVTQHGVLCQEELRNVCFNLLDAQLYEDPASRAPDQIIPAARRALYAGVMTASPRLMEPVYLVEIRCPIARVGGVFGLLGRRRGEVLQERQLPITDIFVLRVYLPVNESFGFTVELGDVTGGRASWLYVFDHWRIIPSDPLDPDSEAGKIVKRIRMRKGLKECVPCLNDFLDEL